MKKIILILIAVLFLFTSCFENTDITTGEIVGSISDKTTGEPIAIANIVLIPGGYSTVTGSDGSFIYKDINPGKYTIEINKEGYLSASKEVEVSMGKTSVVHLLTERVPDKVTADRDLLNFGNNLSLNTITFGIVNPSYEDLGWKIVENSEWITKVTPSEGVLIYGKTESIVVEIDRSKLEEGDNIANLVVRSTNGYTEVKVTAVGEMRPQKAQIEIYEATDIRGYSAILNANIIDPGYPTYIERGFVYSTNQDPTIDNCIGKATSPKNTTLEYSAKIENLTLNTKYYVRAYAINEEGVAYSSVNKEFTTIPVLPEVSTEDIYGANLSEGTATFRGTIVSEGEPTYTECGFVYSTMPNPTINDNKITKNMTGTGSFSVSVEDLSNETYYVRAYAKNEAGIVYGTSVAIVPKVIIIPGTNLMVQTSDLGIYHWIDAYRICDLSMVEGYDDWRLPTLAELKKIYSNRDYIGDLKNEGYWSADMYGFYDYEYDYYYINFSNGTLSSKSTSEYLNVRAVRTIE